jgi:hypothetical protein
MMRLIAKDKVSFVELMNEYYKYFGKRYVTLDYLKFDIEDSCRSLDTDDFYVYNKSDLFTEFGLE